MPITTKTGDKGKTDLYFGKRVNKNDLRVEVYRTLDELSSFLAFSKSLIKNKNVKTVLGSIQHDLYTISAEIATESRCLNRLEERIGNKRINWLEGLIKEYEKNLKLNECCFYMAGGNPISASLDIARTVCRRTERLAVDFKIKGLLKNKYILIYLNRLSDLLYLMERRYEKKYVKMLNKKKTVK